MVALSKTTSGRDALRCGVVFEATKYIIASHFLLSLLQFSPLGFVFYLMAILYGAVWGLLAFWGSYRMERASGMSGILFFPVFYMVLEKVRSLTDLSFPADLLAHCFGTQPAFLAWTRWTGTYGVPLWAGMTGLLWYTAYTHRSRKSRAALWAAAGIVLFLGPPITDVFMAAPPPAPGGRLRVGIVQPSAPPDFKLKKEHWAEAWATLERLTEEAAVGADLVIWPETSRLGVILSPEQGPFSDPPMEELARKVGVPILYGCRIGLVRDGKDVVALYNGAALVHPDGKPGEWYGKQRLLPFVEGVPFADLIGWDPATRAKSGPRKTYLGMLGNFSPGPELTIFKVGPARLGVLICYEGFYPQLTRAYQQKGANALVVMTNDMWWGKTIFPTWHARMIAARVRETGLPVVRAANNGISSQTDLRGRMGRKTQTNEVRTLQVDLDISGGHNNFYLRVGDWPVWLGALVLIGASLWALARRYRG